MGKKRPGTQVALRARCPSAQRNLVGGVFGLVALLAQRATQVLIQIRMIGFHMIEDIEILAFRIAIHRFA